MLYGILFSVCLSLVQCFGNKLKIYDNPDYDEVVTEDERTNKQMNKTAFLLTLILYLLIFVNAALIMKYCLAFFKLSRILHSFLSNCSVLLINLCI